MPLDAPDRVPGQLDRRDFFRLQRRRHFDGGLEAPFRFGQGALPTDVSATARMMISLARRRKGNGCTMASRIACYLPVHAANDGGNDMATGVSRRHVLAAAGGALMSGSIGESTAATGDWTTAKPSEAGFADDLADRLDKAVADKRIWNVHAVIVVRGGRLVLERYFEG